MACEGTLACIVADVGVGSGTGAQAISSSWGNPDLALRDGAKIRTGRRRRVAEALQAAMCHSQTPESGITTKTLGSNAPPGQAQWQALGGMPYGAAGRTRGAGSRRGRSGRHWRHGGGRRWRLGGW